MHIDLDLLFSWGAIAKEYKKNDTIFNEDDLSNFFFQIIEGTVKMINLNDEGKEFTQGYFSEGQSFGEPPLLIDENYPSAAIAMCDSKIIKLSKDKFFKILDEYPCIHRNLLNLLAKRIHSKAITTKAIINQKPEYRINAFLKAHKSGLNNGSKELVNFTRQEIANFTGLRVETVIRELSKMSKINTVEIINHKIYY